MTALFDNRLVKVCACVVVAFIVIGSALKVDRSLRDMFNGMMVLPNLIALLTLSGTVAGSYQNLNSNERLKTHK